MKASSTHGRSRWKKEPPLQLQRKQQQQVTECQNSPDFPNPTQFDSDSTEFATPLKVRFDESDSLFQMPDLKLKLQNSPDSTQDSPISSEIDSDLTQSLKIVEDDSESPNPSEFDSDLTPSVTHFNILEDDSMIPLQSTPDSVADSTSAMTCDAEAVNSVDAQTVTDLFRQLRDAAKVDRRSIETLDQLLMSVIEHDDTRCSQLVSAKIRIGSICLFVWTVSVLAVWFYTSDADAGFRGPRPT